MTDALSQGTGIKSGVPQRSVIGPLLFLLLVNDLPSVINVITLLYVDDAKMVPPRSKCDLLQGSLYNVWTRSVSWHLPINATKCKCIDIGRAPPLQLSFATGNLGNSIHVANVVKDLGVLMDDSFSPSSHCNEAASKARRMLFMIKRSFDELSVSAFAALFNTLVRSHLEYAMQNCSPSPVADADYLEQIQRLATRLAKGFRRLPYEERLRMLGLHSLRRRRLRGDVIVEYRIIGILGLDLDSSLFLFRHCGLA